jgi:hypothetical protein
LDELAQWLTLELQKCKPDELVTGSMTVRMSIVSA